MAVTNVAELNALVERVKKAQREYASFTQEQVDKIFRAAALAAADARIPLAKMAVAESGMGIVEDKVIKNHFASEYIYNAYKDEKTCGVLSEDDTFGTITIAEPIGIICGIVPTTNPTSTAIFKSLISLKTRNAIIFWRLQTLDGRSRRVVLQERLNFLVLLVEDAHINDQVTDNRQTWQRTNDQLVAFNDSGQRRYTRQAVLAVDVHAVGAANALTARATIGETLVLLFDQGQYVQHHQVFTVGIDLEFLHERSGVLIRVVTINTDFQHIGHP